MAQVASIILMHYEQFAGKLAVFAGMDGVRFRRFVEPGDQLLMTAELTKLKGTFARVRSEAKVGDQLVAEGEFLFSLVD